jgi:hypothetical protein
MRARSTWTARVATWGAAKSHLGGAEKRGEETSTHWVWKRARPGGCVATVTELEVCVVWFVNKRLQRARETPSPPTATRCSVIPGEHAAAVRGFFTAVRTATSGGRALSGRQAGCAGDESDDRAHQPEAIGGRSSGKYGRVSMDPWPVLPVLIIAWPPAASGQTRPRSSTRRDKSSGSARRGSKEKQPTPQPACPASISRWLSERRHIVQPAPRHCDQASCHVCTRPRRTDNGRQ